MKGFKLDANGDVVIDKDIEIVEDSELVRQTIQTVIATNKGEWQFNKNEGINFNNILVKNPNYEIIKSEIIDGLSQVDENFELQEFECSLDKKTRKLNVYFSAKKLDETTIFVKYSY